MAETALPPLDDCGFVRVPSAKPEDGDGQLWMTCESCKKSDHFWIDGAICCRCGARYGHAVRPDGSTVPLDQLELVPFKQGPLALADTEWDPVRIAISLAVFGGVVAALFYFLL